MRVCVGGEVGRSELNAVVEKERRSLGTTPFEHFTVGVAEADPEAVELGRLKKDLRSGSKSPLNSRTK